MTGLRNRLENAEEPTKREGTKTDLNTRGREGRPIRNRVKKKVGKEHKDRKFLSTHDT